MSSIPPTLKYVEGFTVMGLRTKTQNSDEFNEKTAKLPGLWQQFYASELAINANIFGVYSNYESNVDGLYTVTVGVKTDDEPNTPVFCTINVLPGEYLVFENQGVTPHVVVETWQNVWTYFKSQPKFTRRFKTDFEMYKNGEDIAIYIGI